MSIGILIPTYNPDKGIYQLLSKIKNYQEFKKNVPVKVLIIDSSESSDWYNHSKYTNINFEFFKISQKEYNHGATRELGRKKLNSDIIVMVTQDILPYTDDSIDVLIKPIIEGASKICYGRQLPKADAGILEAFPREYNYPVNSHTRTIKDIETYGVYTFFCSNSFAAYDNRALEEIEGFKPTLTWEDYFAVASLLQLGYKISYVAEAMVYHSHKYTLTQEFKRYFDAGYVRAENNNIDKLITSAEPRGIEYGRLLLKKIYKENKRLLPYSIINTIIKWLGYRIGYYSLKMPLFWKKMLSAQEYYWTSKYYKNYA